MPTKSLHLIGLIALAAAALHAQPTTGAVFWSTDPNLDCSSLGESAPVAIPLAAGTGYSCYTTGTFVYLAAGGGWGTELRVAAPFSAPVGVDYSFYDTSGNPLSLDTTGSYTQSGNDLNFALYANQPAEVELAGATSNAAAGYNLTTVGSVYVAFYCPDATTCGNVLPQLIYSNLPTHPWSLSVPIAWDTAVWTQWSAEGIDDGGGRRVSLVIYNEDTTAATYTVSVYNSSGTLIGSGTTPSIPPLQDLGGGALGEGGAYANLLANIISTPLPSGIFKVYVDGGAVYSAVEVLQFTGSSATTLQVAYDGPSTSTSVPTLRSNAAVRRSNVSRMRAESAAKAFFKTSPQ